MTADQQPAPFKKSRNSPPERIAEALDLIISMAEMDFSRRLQVSGDGTALDGLAVGLNMLTEELKFSVTSKSELQAALAESRALERKFRSIFDQESVAIVFVSLQGVILEANKKYAELSGLTCEEAVGKYVIDLIHPDDRAPSLAGLKKMAAGELNELVVERRYAWVNGGPRWNLLRSSTVRDEFGRPQYLVSVLYDITAQKNLEESLRLAKAEAEAANRAKGEFLASMTHEIRTPLSAIIGFAELIAEPSVSRAQKQKYVAAIHRNKELLSRIINDVLDLSKVEAGKLEVSREKVSIRELFNHISELFTPKAAEKGLTFQINKSESVLQHIWTDPHRLKQILINIIGNAIKATDRGNVSVDVRAVKNAEGEQSLAIAVTDTGSGIASDQMEKLFKPFSQTDSSKTAAAGTGLGLVLSRRLARLLGGDVVLFASSVDRGSVFLVTIDAGLSQVAGTPMADTRPESRAEAPLPRLAGRRILFADDNIDNRELVADILTLAGAEVRAVADGKQALQAATEATYDVLLMDLDMPVMDGAEATKALRQAGYTGTIVALTAHSLASQRRKILESGFDACLNKPIDRGQLLRLCAGM